MNLPLPGPVLAVDFGWVIFIVFIVIGILNTLLKAAGGKQQPPAAPRPPRPGQGRLQNEIDAFLKQVRGKEAPDDVPIEIVPEQERRPRPAGRRQQSKKPPQRPPRPKPQQSEPHDAPGSEIAARQSPGSRQLGEQVRSHHLEANVGEHVNQYMDDRVDEGVADHLGAFSEGRRTAAVQLPRAAAGRTHKLVSLLRDPVGVRQAIVLNEILSRPKGRRIQGES